MAQLSITKKNNVAIEDKAQQLICYATIQQLQSWQAVLDCYTQLKQQHPKHRVLLLLEDIAQCNYTSMHAANHDRLYFDTTELTEGQDDPIWENIRPNEVQYHRQQLLLPENKVELKQLSDKLSYTEEDFAAVLQINQHPAAILDQVIEVKLVDGLNHDSEKFAAQLNGYFSCDLDPFECFALVQCLEQDFGFEYIGLGASLLFFIKTTHFDSTKIDQLFKQLDLLYHFPEAVKHQLQQQLLEQQHLILPYVESLETFDFD